MTTTQLIEPLSSIDTPPGILLPDPERLFARRQKRFAALAAGHALGDWLAYLGRLTGAQHECCLSIAPDLPLPPLQGEGRGGDGARMATKPMSFPPLIPHLPPSLPLEGGGVTPPLSPTSYPRPAVWIDVAKRIAASLAESSPQTMRARIAAFQALSPEQLDAMADTLINGRPDSGALPEYLLVAAGLQTIWTALAARLDANALPRLAPPGVCPVCGSPPVGSVVRTSAQVNNLRYLHCSLCNTEWNLPRAVCTACATDQAVSYRQIEGGNSAVRAECCDHCHSYLKIFAQEKDPDVDPVADDLATVALDLLVDETGYARSGPNLFLLGGAGV